MKEKNVAGILALFLGGLGVHRFYLGQTGLGIFYLIFFWFPVMWIVGLIDAISFFSMDTETFDRKYNREYLYRQQRRMEQERSYRPPRQETRRDDRYSRRYDTARQRPAAAPATRKRASSPERKRENPHKKAGIEQFKDYDYDAAIESFRKALRLEPNDIATHFNIACAYSINEQPDKAFYHLDQAVANGFTDFDRIRQHDKLAFLRIQDEFEAFAANGFRLEHSKAEETQQDSRSETADPPGTEEPVEDHSELLEQLKRLGDLKEKGLLTEEEFSMQKRKLLG